MSAIGVPNQRSASDASYRRSVNLNGPLGRDRIAGSPRQAPPPPLRLKDSTFTSSSGRATPTAGHHPSQSPTALLYELPPSSSSPRRSTIPISPPIPSRSSLLHHPRASPHNSQPNTPYSGPTSPPPRSRSSTPLPAKKDLDKFAEHCHAW